MLRKESVHEIRKQGTNGQSNVDRHHRSLSHLSWPGVREWVVSDFHLPGRCTTIKKRERELVRKDEASEGCDEEASPGSRGGCAGTNYSS
mmetsp:Transcript_9940/g.14876  ORF Transcript_9940/g.14876 Transcript_9940/m.14876 type:complete len:90 (-) Transcript_9940:260-529(-)